MPQVDSVKMQVGSISYLLSRSSLYCQPLPLGVAGAARGPGGARQHHPGWGGVPGADGHDEPHLRGQVRHQ